MSGVTDATNGATTAQESVDTPMESPKGKGKQTEQMAVDDSEESEEDEADAEAEEPDDDNMEEIDTDNIVNARTRGVKSVDYAEADKQMPKSDEDDDDEDDDFEEDDDKMED